MDKDKKEGTPPVDPQTAAERFAALQAGGHAAVRGKFGDGRPPLVWHGNVGTALDKEPGGRFSYVIGKLIPDDKRLALAVRAMKEILSRCRTRGEETTYVPARKSEIDATRFEADVRKHLPHFKGQVAIATPAELVPRRDWMSEESWELAYSRFVEAMTNADGFRPQRRRTPHACLFNAVPFKLEEFELPARCVFPNGLVHQPLLGDLAGFLAVAASFCAGREFADAERACAFVSLAAKAPPIVVETDAGPNLVFVCAD